MITHDLDSLWRVTDRVAFLAEKKVHRIASMPELTQDDSPIIQAYFQGPRGQAARQRQWTAKPTTP
jgi:phospholipid/cholesterol/gamma-HCH transport system ATP-binding protein